MNSLQFFKLFLDLYSDRFATFKAFLIPRIAHAFEQVFLKNSKLPAFTNFFKSVDIEVFIPFFLDSLLVACLNNHLDGLSSPISSIRRDIFKVCRIFFPFILLEHYFILYPKKNEIMTAEFMLIIKDFESNPNQQNFVCFKNFVDHLTRKKDDGSEINEKTIKSFMDDFLVFEASHEAFKVRRAYDLKFNHFITFLLECFAQPTFNIFTVVIKKRKVGIP